MTVTEFTGPMFHTRQIRESKIVDLEQFMSLPLPHILLTQLYYQDCFLRVSL